MTSDNKPPIFILWTRSFWAFLATAFGTLMLASDTFLDAGEPAIRAAVTVVSLVFDIDIDAVTLWVVDIAPIITLIIAAQQRSGQTRAYTWRLSKETL